MNIAVYCSANSNISPAYFRAAEELGKWMGQQGHTLVFGGCNLGLMECIGKAVHDAGGRCIGVVPTIIEKGGKKSDYIDVDIPCDNLSDRKDLMLMHSDVAVALPGGIGTLDEVFTMAAAATIGYHQKRVILYNIDGFWQPLIALLDTLQQRGFVRGNYTRMITVANSFEELKDCLPPTPSKGRG